MPTNSKLFTIVILSFLLLFKNAVNAQVQAWDEERRGCIYVGAGSSLVNTYGHTTLKIDQTKLNNNYQINSLTGSNTGTTTPAFSPLQLNYRMGYYFTYNQTWAVELNFDPATYYVKDGQNASLTGTMGGINVNKTIVFSAANGYHYALNGADLLLINVVKRHGLFWGQTHKVRFDVFGKLGIGPAMPKTTAILNGETISPKYQLTGWNTGAEVAARVTLMRYVYLELAAKYDHASFSGINIYDGTAAQTLNITSVTGTIGFTLPTTRHHPLFEKGEKKHRIITLRPMYPSDAK